MAHTESINRLLNIESHLRGLIEAVKNYAAAPDDAPDGYVELLDSLKGTLTLDMLVASTDDDILDDSTLWDNATLSLWLNAEILESFAQDLVTVRSLLQQAS